MKRQGIFICIEGLDGSGKTTHAYRLVQNLKNHGFDAMYTTEPSKGELGNFIRRVILERKNRIPRAVEALLFAVDRVEHFDKEVKPALKEGKVVISDRCVYSSLAYQGAAGLDLKWIQEINRFALSPDLAIYIDVPPEVAVKRIQRKKSVMERLETQQKVQEVYMSFVETGKLVSIDGDKPKRTVEKSMLSVILEFLQTRT